MNLDEGQRKKVGEWIDLGLRLSDIQERIASEMGLKLTYMDVRLLVDDLKLTPKDAETSRHVKTTLEGPATPPAAGRKETAVSDIASSKAADSVSIQLDQIADQAQSLAEKSPSAMAIRLNGISIKWAGSAWFRKHLVTARQRPICSSFNRFWIKN
jgi:hypothetical protein